MPLTDIACRNLKPGPKPLKVSDGGGLFLLVQPTGGKLWRFAYRLDRKQKTLAVGRFPEVSLALARRRRDEAKELIAVGVDPSKAKVEAKEAKRAKTEHGFEAIACEWHEQQKPAWAEGYADHVLTRLKGDIFPLLGKRPIAEIEPPELLEAIRKIEARGAQEIARRTLAVCGQIFRYAIVTGRGTRDPSADLRGALKARPRQVHHRAMSQADLPGFLRQLASYDGEQQTALALRMAVLTFVRTTELRAARWSEFEHLDGKAPLWRIPAERMKMKTEHLVPLAPQAVGVLRELKALAGESPFVFPSKGAERFMSNNTMLFGLYRMGYHGRATVHGFRGLASTVLNEMGFPPDWIERQLAHDERNKIRGAYNSAQHLPERRRMMVHWANFLSEVETSGKVDIQNVSTR